MIDRQRLAYAVATGPALGVAFRPSPRRSIEESPMPNHHPSRSWRGCAMCKPYKRRGAGRAVKELIPVLRVLGKKRRVGRGDLGDQREG